MQRLKSFDELKHGDLIISPIDCEVTQFYIDKDGEKYLAGKKSLFPIYQFNAEDFFRYDGELQNGETDKAFFER